jgi:O-acetyl-ADP-ribose deacetylase (regulator of RNase III)
MAIRTIAIVGAGVLGREIAKLSAHAGYQTILEDLTGQMLDRVMVEMAAGLDLRDLARIRPQRVIEDAVRTADLVIEAAPEDLDTKLEVFTILDKVAPPAAILATTTTVQSVTEIAAITLRAGSMIGMRFGGIHLGPRLEIVRTRDTREDVLVAVEEMGRRMGKETIRIQDWPGEVSFEMGDITKVRVDAIVNAANTDLILGTGVAGAIRRAGGEVIQKECDRLGPVALGEAAITGGGQLPASYVIHAAGMPFGGGVTAESCRKATANSLRRAEEKKLASIAFPAIGTGVGGLDMQKCAQVMLGAVRDHVSNPTSLKRVVFVLFEESARRIFEKTWHELGKERS